MEENIGSLERVSGHTYDTIYDLIFTTERVIAVIIQHPNDALCKFDATALLLGGRLARGKGRFQRMKIAEERRREYKENPFDELVAGHRFSFEIFYSTVTSVELTGGLFKSRLKFHISRPSTPERSIRFTFAKKQLPNARHLLELALPSKIKGK